MRTESHPPRIGVAALLAALSFVPAAASAADIFYSGQATGVEGTVNIAGTDVDVLLGNTGMSCQGLPHDETVAGISNPDPLKLSAKNVHVYTLGKNGKAQADATMSSLAVGLPGLSISADSVGAHVRATCDVASGNVTVSGHSDFTNLMVNGQAYDVKEKKQIKIPDVGYVYFDQHRNFGNEMRVYAIHVRLDNASPLLSGDVYIGKVRAKTICNP